MRCAVLGCNNNNKKSRNLKDMNLKYFRFPKDENIREQWIVACGRNDQFNVKCSRICSKHFCEEDFQLQHRLGVSCANSRIVKQGALPKLLLPKRSTKNDSSSQALEARKIVCNEFVDDERLDANTEIEMLEEELKHERERNGQLEIALSKIFTPGEMFKLKNPRMRLKWSVNDIADCIAIHSAGPQAYRLLLKKKYPLAAVSTLRAWGKKIGMQPGIIKPLLRVLKSVQMPASEKLCVLSLGEMKIKKLYMYDKANDEILKPANYVQVMIARGLVGNWQQPVFFSYDYNVTTQILFSVIINLEKHGYHVVAIVGDLGGSNQSLYNCLGISVNKTFFTHPSKPSDKIYVFANVPNLIKLLRNHFLDSGFVINGVEITKDILTDLMNKTAPSDPNIAHNLSPLHLKVTGAQRNNIKLATQLFSDSVYSAITWWGTQGDMCSSNWPECAEFIKQVNDWFDVLNVRVPYSDGSGIVRPYGMCLEHQNSILDEMSTTIEMARVKGRNTLLPFQTGILIANTSLKHLYNDIKEKYGFDYILTYRLNQDILENLFSMIRAKRDLHDHPTALEFKYRFRSYLLGGHEEQISSNIEVDYTSLPSTETENFEESNIPVLSQTLFRALNVPEEDFESTEEFDELINSGNEELINDLDYECLQNVARYICFKLKNVEPDLSIPTSSSNGAYDCVDHLYEGLNKPTESFMLTVQALEKIFREFNGGSLTISSNYIKQLLEKSTWVPCSERVKHLFFRCRMFLRMKYLNSTINSGTPKKSRKIVKK